MTALMIDIETLSTHPRAVVLQIGYALGDLETGTIIETGQWDVDLDEQQGRHVCPRTLAWWAQQGKAAQKVLDVPVDSRVSPQYVFNELKRLVEEAHVSSVWAKQASFDFGILADLWGDRPWPFWYESDMRGTMQFIDPDKTLAPVRAQDNLAHVAKDDAEFQLLHLIAMSKHMESLHAVAKSEKTHA